MFGTLFSKTAIVKLRLALVVLTVLASVGDSAFGSSTDRTVLYGITPDGKLYYFDTTTGAATFVKQVPSLLTCIGSSCFVNLGVYKGTFISSDLISVNVSNAMAFGTQTSDEIRLAGINRNVAPGDSDDQLKDLTEYAGNGLMRGWSRRVSSAGVIRTIMREFSPGDGEEYDISSSEIVPAVTFSPYWTCYPIAQALGSAFYGSSKSYFVRSCDRNDGYSAATTQLVRVELQSGTWSKTLDVLPGIGNFPASLVADPNLDGTLYVGFSTTGALAKVVIVGSAVTVTVLTSNAGISSITGLAFGPPVADIVEPTNIDEIAKFRRASFWKPVEKLLLPHGY